jgi:transcriptional regulator MftR-like protein
MTLLTAAATAPAPTATNRVLTWLPSTPVMWLLLEQMAVQDYRAADSHLAQECLEGETAVLRISEQRTNAVRRLARLELEPCFKTQTRCLDRALENRAFRLVAHAHMHACSIHLDLHHVPVPGDLRQQSKSNSGCEISKRRGSGMLATNALTLVAEHFEALDMRHLAHAVKRLDVGLDLVFSVCDCRVQRGWQDLHLGQFHNRYRMPPKSRSAAPECCHCEPPLDKIRWAVRDSLALVYAEARDDLLARIRLILATPALRARLFVNQGTTADLLARSFGAASRDWKRNLRAKVIAAACLAAMTEAILMWAQEDGVRPLPELIDRALDVLRRELS